MPATVVILFCIENKALADRLSKLTISLSLDSRFIGSPAALAHALAGQAVILVIDQGYCSRFGPDVHMIIAQAPPVPSLLIGDRDIDAWARTINANLALNTDFNEAQIRKHLVTLLDLLSSARSNDNKIDGEKPAISQQKRPNDGLAGIVDLHLERYFRLLDETGPPPGLYRRVLHEVERPLLQHVMRAAKGNQMRAARWLGLNRNTLRKKLTEIDGADPQ